MKNKCLKNNANDKRDTQNNQMSIFSSLKIPFENLFSLNKEHLRIPKFALDPPIHRTCRPLRFRSANLK